MTDDTVNHIVHLADETVHGARPVIEECLDRIDKVRENNCHDHIVEAAVDRGGWYKCSFPKSDCELIVAVDTSNRTYRGEIEPIIKSDESDLERLIIPSGGGSRVEWAIDKSLENGVDVTLVPTGPVVTVTDEMSKILSEHVPVGQAWSGRPPLGFEVECGRLIEADRYRRVRAVLKLVIDGDLSKRAAARELDVARRTVGRALDNRERYGLD